MKNLLNLKNYIYCFFLAIFSFLLNFYVGNSGVFPVDTFLHYDSGYRILLGEHPVKDYWIVHGFLIDYMQAFFFKLFGNEWKSYLYHSSIFNTCITLFSYYIFRLLNLEVKISLLISSLIAILAYPISGTPFLDLHSSYFSLFAIYFGIVAVKKDKAIFWFWSSFLLNLAFFSKQVPAGYTIILISLFVIYLAIVKKNFYIFLNYAAGALLFLIILTLFLILNKIQIHNFILQIFQFPLSIGTNRYGNYSLGLKNVILDYKFIYIIFVIIVIFNIREYLRNKKINIEKINIFWLLSLFIFSTIFHQIYTKNQTYIFFLIPICAGFALFYNNLEKNNYKKYLNIFIISITIISTFKYHERFNIKRKFHELQYIDISNSLNASKIHKKFNSLKWISPYYDNPEKEIFFISEFIEILNKEQKVMVITQYNFYSSLIEKKLYSPSRTYDLISYPKKNTKYYNLYKKHLIKLLNKNKIKKIYIFERHSNLDLNHLIFDYISHDCFYKKNLNENLILLEIKKCETLS